MKTTTSAAPAELIAIARVLDSTCPARPLRMFVDQLVTQVHQKTGVVHGESWYRRLIKDAGVDRRPSTRTVNACVQRVRERVGDAPGATAVTVRELRRSMADLVGTVARLEGLVTKIESAAARQQAISEAIDRRQMIFQDAAGDHQRQIDRLSEEVRQLIASGKVVHKAALDTSLDTARLIRSMQQSAAGGP